MKRVFAIGDIHGCATTLDRLLTQSIQLNKSDRLVFLGDYIDRGPDSKTVVDIILNLKNSGYAITCLKGNHEQMMLDSELDDYHVDYWIKNGGGAATLRSFGIPKFALLAPTYKQFFNELDYYTEINNYILVHAALNFAAEDIFADREAMLWNRKMEIDYHKLQNRYIIHGHTPQSLSHSQAQLANFETARTLCIDGGCVYARPDDPGYLIAFELNSKELFFAENAE